MQFLSVTKLDVPMVYHSPKLATEMTNEVFPVLEKIQQITGINPTIAYERQNGGVFEMDRLSSLNRLNKFTIFKMPRYGDVHHQTEVKLGWDCVGLGTKILTADMRWKVAEKIQIGEELIAFEENPPAKGDTNQWGYRHRRFNIQKVLRTSHFQAQGYKVTLEDGRTIEVSDNHPLLTYRSDVGESWRRADELYVGLRVKTIPVWEPLQTFDAGRLSGLLCGEGYLNSTFCKKLDRYSGLRLHIAQSEGELAEEIMQLWSLCGFQVTFKNVRHAASNRSHHKTMVYSGINSSLDVLLALGKLQPKRLIRRLREKNFLSAYTTARLPRLKITKIEKIDNLNVIGIETSGHTLITNGILSHNTNTATRPKMLADLKEAVDKQLIKIYDRPTIEEMFSFIIVKTTMSEKAMAESGAHDDLVMSLAIAWQLYQMTPKPNPIQDEQAREIYYQRANEDF